MSITITYAVDEILHFLEDIPLSANTVKYYGFCYREVLRYCSENSLIFFHTLMPTFFIQLKKSVYRWEKSVIRVRLSCEKRLLHWQIIFLLEPFVGNVRLIMMGFCLNHMK